MADISKILLGRRSIRKYSADPVEDNLLNDILTMGCRASTTGNMQIYSIIVTRDNKRSKSFCLSILTRK